MMTTIQSQKIFGIIFRTIFRRRICLAFLSCHFTFFVFANFPDAETKLSEKDSLSVPSQFSVIGEIKVQGGATIVEVNNYSSTYPQKGIPKNKFVLKRKTKTSKSETPEKIHLNIARSNKAKLVPSPSLGVSF